MNRAAVAECFRRFENANPEPRGELEHRNAFELLIAVILSAQATDKGVNRATAPLFAIANSPEAILALGLDGLTTYIRSIGLYPTKAKNILATCQQLIEHFNSTVPETRAELETLPGVGRKTANVVLNIAFGQPTMGVDTHVFRVANRTGMAIGKTPLAVETRLMQVIPTEFMRHAHHWLILHGRYTCTARSPHCGTCPIADLCATRRKTP
ncbi:MAG: endonuclease III [Betaproteobacteria bacterium]|nr:MAG: endonuclease III [Betaproteobacteria bacterium]